MICGAIFFITCIKLKSRFVIKISKKNIFIYIKQFLKIIKVYIKLIFFVIKVNLA